MLFVKGQSSYTLCLFEDISHPEKLYKLGQAVRARVVEASFSPHRFVLSLTGKSYRRTI